MPSPAPGVANIDPLKRSNVSSDSLERVLLDALRERERQTVLAMSAPTEKTEFEFGRICGICQERQAIQFIIENYFEARDRSGRDEEP